MADKKIKSSEASMPQQLRNMVVCFGVGRVKHELEQVVKSIKGDQPSSGQVTARFISPEARQRIAEAQHRRWAKVRAAKAKASKSAVVKAKASSAKAGKPGRSQEFVA